MFLIYEAIDLLLIRISNVYVCRQFNLKKLSILLQSSTFSTTFFHSINQYKPVTPFYINIPNHSTSSHLSELTPVWSRIVLRSSASQQPRNCRNSSDLTWEGSRKSVTPKGTERREDKRQETRAKELRETRGPPDSEVSGGRGPARCQLVSLSAHARWHRASQPRVDSHRLFARRMHTTLRLSARHALFRARRTYIPTLNA